MSPSRRSRKRPTAKRRSRARAPTRRQPRQRARKAPLARPQAIVRLRVRVVGLEASTGWLMVEAIEGGTIVVPLDLGAKGKLPIEPGDECWLVVETERKRGRR